MWQRMHRTEKIGLALFGLLVIAFLMYRTQLGSNDINVYLYASQQFFAGEDIYANNPYNNYLYAPVFALLLGVISFLPWDIARFIWFLVNLLAYARTFQLLYKLTRDPERLPIRWRKIWSVSVVLLSLGFINHNINLGQISMIMVWLSVEGAYLVLQKDRPVQGAWWLALGMVVKIVPGLVFFYLLVKGHWRALIWGGIFSLFLLVIPTLWQGWQYNWRLLQSWEQTINPGKEKYVFENNNGNHALNAMLPSYFYDFQEPEHYGKYGWPRKIATLAHGDLLIILQVLRLLLVASLVRLVWLQRKQRSALHFMREISYLLLVSYLIFPHQRKYAMLYAVPAAAYLGYAYLHHAQGPGFHGGPAKLGLSLFILTWVVLTVMGRDIIGNTAVNFLDYYHFMTGSVFLFLVLIWYWSPHRIAVAQE